MSWQGTSITPLQQNIVIALKENSVLCFRDFYKLGIVKLQCHRYFQKSIRIFIDKGFIKGYMRKLKGCTIKRKYYELTLRGENLANQFIRLRE
jgi:hypothetical protein